MKILFCGTPDFAVPSLKKLHALAPVHEVVGVVSQPDKPKGRSGIPTPPPVAAAALELGIPSERILQPRSINKPEVLDAIRALKPDILCVIAYGNILKADALNLGIHFPINAHASLLPKYRGAAPIQAALLAGDAETGVCVMKMEAGLDTGPVLLRHSIPIEQKENAGTLHDKLATLSADCFAQAIDMIERNAFTLEPQDDTRASYAGKLEKSSGYLNYEHTSIDIERRIRAMTPWPGAWTLMETVAPLGAANSAKPNSVRIRVAEASVIPPMRREPELPTSESCGFCMTRGTPNAAYFEIQCGNSTSLAVSRIQPEGKREMSVSEYLRGAGHPFQKWSLWSAPKYRSP